VRLDDVQAEAFGQQAQRRWRVPGELVGHVAVHRVDVWRQRAYDVGPPVEGGPLLLQLPPSFDRSMENRRALATYLEHLPTRELQLAVELRHAAWADASVGRAFAERNIAWCLVDGNTPNARSLMFPADFTYIRWNRSGRLFDGFSHIQYDRSEGHSSSSSWVIARGNFKPSR